MVEVGGQPFVLKGNDDGIKVHILIKGKELTLRGPRLGTLIALSDPVDNHFTFTVDPAKSPKWLNLAARKAPDDLTSLAYLGYYRLDEDNLEICLNLANKTRPAAFKTEAGTFQFLIELKRDPKAKWKKLPKREGVPQPGQR